MIGTIRKHSKWLWLIIVTATIFTFVYWGSNTGRYDSGGRVGDLGSIDGKRITPDEYTLAHGEVFLRYFTQTGQWPDRNAQKSGFDEERETYQRLFLLRKLESYNIQVDNASVAKSANDILRGFGGGTPLSLDTFVQKVLSPQANLQDFQRFLRNELAIDQLFSVLGLSGKLVMPAEAQAIYEREYREISTEAVFFTISNYLASVPAPSADALAQYYTNEMDKFRIPERVQLSYVEFNFTNKLAEAEKALTNLNELVESNFREVGTNYTRYGKTPEEARARIREGLIYKQAQPGIREIRGRADELVGTLLEVNPNLAQVAKTNGLTVKVTKPFETNAGPAEFDGGPNFSKVVSSLTPASPVAGQAFNDEKAFYVVVLDKLIPGETPSLQNIRDRVLADYKSDKALSLAYEAARVFVSNATNALAQGKAFAAICADAQVKPFALPPFSMRRGNLAQIDEIMNPYAFRRYVFNTPPGKITDIMPTREGALIVHVIRQLPVDQAAMKAQLPALLTELRRMRQSEAINEWFGREAMKSMPDSPIFRPRKPADQTDQ